MTLDGPGLGRDKDADAFRTISEVAVDLDIPQHVLRFWETRFPQVRPLKRAGGRRYYRPADVELLRGIRRLLYDDGYTIKGVQRLFRERGGKDRGRTKGDDGPPPPVPAPVPAPAAAGEAAAPASAEAIGEEGDALADALAAVDDCRRILAAARQSAA